MSSSTPPPVNGTSIRFQDVSFSSYDGIKLKARFWTSPNPRAVLVIAHGLGEHGGSYRRLAEALVPRLSIDVLGPDFRGSGASQGKRGVVGDYSELTQDLTSAMQWVAEARPGSPVFLLGHSNGGLVSLLSILDRNLRLSGLILSNPSLKLQARVPYWKLLAAEVLLKIAPRATLTTGLSNDQLTRDPVIMAEIEGDPLRHDRISPPLYFGMRAGGPVVIERANEIKLPTLMILGGSDPIIDPETGKKFFEKLGSSDKTLKIYPEMRHEPLNEVGREVVVADIVQWIGERLG